MGMNLDMTGVDHQPFIIRFFYQTSLKLGPNSLVTPTAKATVGVFPAPIITWQVSPRSACAQNPENSIDKQSVIASHPPPLSLLAREMGFE